MADFDPKFASIQRWCQLTGMGRSKTYYALAAGDLHAIKVGSRTLIDVEAGMSWLRSQPAAQIRTLPKQKAAA